MSEPPENRYRVINQRDQPVELHCGGQVVVLAARAIAELGDSEIAQPQLQGLARRGLLSIQPLPEAEPAEDETAEAKAAGKPTRQASSKARGGKAK